MRPGAENPAKGAALESTPSLTVCLITVLSGPRPLISTDSLTSRSPVELSPVPPFSAGWVSFNVPFGNSISSLPGLAFAWSIAARSVHLPFAVAQLPSPTSASIPSLVESTSKVSPPAEAGAGARRATSNHIPPRVRASVLMSAILRL